MLNVTIVANNERSEKVQECKMSQTVLAVIILYSLYWPTEHIFNIEIPLLLC